MAHPDRLRLKHGLVETSTALEISNSKVHVVGEPALMVFHGSEPASKVKGSGSDPD
jgi:hypothetical protein